MAILDQVNHYANERIAIGAALFIAYFFHYMLHTSVYLMKKGNPHELKEIEKNMFLFGVAAILSCNIFQSGVYQAVLCYFTFVFLLLIHLPVLYTHEVFNSKKYFWLGFYLMLFMWYFGIIVDYYDSYAGLK